MRTITMLWIAVLLALSNICHAANTQVIATNVIADGTTSPVLTPSGAKSFYANVVCTNGACTSAGAKIGAFDYRVAGAWKCMG